MCCMTQFMLHNKKFMRLCFFFVCKYPRYVEQRDIVCIGKWNIFLLLCFLLLGTNQAHTQLTHYTLFKLFFFWLCTLSFYLYFEPLSFIFLCLFFCSGFSFFLFFLLFRSYFFTYQLLSTCSALPYTHSLVRSYSSSSSLFFPFALSSFLPLFSSPSLFLSFVI